MEKHYPIAGQVGSQLDTAFFLFDNCIRNPETVPIEEFERMVDTDETIAVGIEFLISSILMKLGEYQHEDQKIADFVNSCFEDMEGNLHTACEDILSALWAGYSGTEIVWKLGSQLKIQRLATYHPRTIYIMVDRQTGEYQGFKQWRWFAGSPVDIPLNKSILHVHNRRFGSHYGRSILKPLRKNWLLKDPILKMWARALDRFGTPLVAIYTPDEQIIDPENPGQMINQLEWAMRLLKNMQDGTGFAFRSGSKEMGGETKAEAITGGSGNIGDAFEKAVQYLNKMLLRGMLVPSLVFDEGQSGSYSLGQSHFGVFNLGIGRSYNSLKETLLEQLVRPLIEYNFGPQKNYGDFVENEIEGEDTKLLYEMFLALTNAGYMDPTIQEDFDEVRHRMGLKQRKVVTPDEKVAAVAEAEYARYTQDGRDIGDPFAQENDARSDETGERHLQTA